MPAEFHPWIAVGVTALVFVGLQLRRGVPTDLLFLMGMVAVTVTGVITPERAYAGFSNPAVLTIAALLVVAEGLRATGVLDWVGRALLGRVQTESGAMLRLVPTLVVTSAFMLNTALVAMMAPVIMDWCRQRQVSPSRLLLPVSYLAILGGVCTLIGTSTTLVANAVLRSQYEMRVAADEQFVEQQPQGATLSEARREFTEGTRPMDLFELGSVGLPCAVIGSIFMLIFGRRLLPNRTDILDQLGDQRREYLVEMTVQADCPLIGRTVEDAGLRHLPGLFLIEIDRNGDLLTPVSPQDIVHAGDRLVFTGIVSTIVDLEKIPGLVPAADMTYEFHPTKRVRRRLTEVVLSRTSPLIGTTVRKANFRQLYNAAVVAVHRNGVRLTNKVGDIRLEPGDTLLLQTRDDFVTSNRNNRDFYLVSGVEGSQSRRHHKARLAAFLSVLLILWLVVGNWPGLGPKLGIGPLPEGLTSPPLVALAIACAMIALGCMRISDARSALDLRVLLTIAGAVALGYALQDSGAADMIARYIVTQLGERPYLLLIVVYLITVVFTEMISNNAVAAMLLPLAIAVAGEGGFHPRPFIMAITLAASLSFITPIGYQTNLMVLGPGGYHPRDYLRCGLPLALVVGVTALALIPQIWPF
jgi:di/tricarboxylate transporter